MRLLVVSGLALFLASGCDSASFVPPRPSELAGRAPGAVEPPGSATSPDRTSTADIPSPARPRLVEMILGWPQSGDRKLMEQVLRRELGIAKTSLRLIKSEGDQALGAGRQVEEIRAAVARGVTLLVLEPIDTPEVRAALLEAEARGIPILLLDLPLPSRQPGKDLPTLSLSGFAECSKQLVAAALEDAKRLGLPADGTILLLQNRSADGYSTQRQESLRTALKDSGRPFHVLEFEGGRSQAASLLTDDLKAHPRVCVVLTEEDYGLGAAIDVHRARSDAGDPDFVVAGYASYDLRIDPEVAARCAGFVERSVGDYAMKISEALRAILDGKPMPGGAKIEVVFVRTESLRKPATSKKTP